MCIKIAFHQQNTSATRSFDDIETTGAVQNYKLYRCPPSIKGNHGLTTQH